MSSADQLRNHLPTKQLAPGRISDRHLPTFLVTALAVFLFFLTYVSPISYAGGDARYSLLVSQALIEHGTTQLDPYIDGADLVADDSRLTKLGTHYYYYSALGTPLFSIPAVWLANWFGLDMLKAKDDFQIQSLLASGLTALVLIVVYHLARSYVQWRASLVIASITVFGSTLVSTMGTALWNFNFAVLFVSLSLLLLVRNETGRVKHLVNPGRNPCTVPARGIAAGFLSWYSRPTELGSSKIQTLASPSECPSALARFQDKYFFGTTLSPYLMGFLLFAAFLSRPTTGLFIGLAFVYLFVFARNFFWTAIATFLFFIGLLVLLSNLEYHLWLPPYYLPERHGMLPPHYLTGYQTEALPFPLHFVLYGLLFSPSRGLFIFSPAFLLVLAGIPLFISTARKQPMFWLVLAWILLEIGLLIRHNMWWGGHSFGPRLLTGIVPAFIVLTAIAWKQIANRLPGTPRRAAATTYILFGIVGILINSHAGLFNIQTAHWNGGLLPPNVDQTMGYLFNWRYPQFLATAQSACSRNQEYMANLLADNSVSVRPYNLGETITYQDAYINLAYAKKKAEFAQSIPRWSLYTSLLSYVERLRSPASRVGYRTYLPLITYNRSVREPVEVTAAFVGWSNPYNEQVLTQCEVSSVVFGQVNTSMADSPLQLTIIAGAPQSQQVSLYLNEHLLGQVSLNSQDTHRIGLDGSMLQQEQVNTLSVIQRGKPEESGGTDDISRITLRSLSIDIIE